MAERDGGRLWLAFRPPRCLPWRELLRACIPWLHKETECSVCREKIKRREKYPTRACWGERFHQRCLVAWRESGWYKTCPSCNAPLDPPRPRSPPRWPPLPPL